MTVSGIPVLGFVAWSGTGKTTLLRRLIPLLREQGLRMGVIKHAHHTFEMDRPGKDSYELRKAGADRVLVGSRQRYALLVEHERQDEPMLADLLPHMQTEGLDLILVEGFKHERFPKVELHRSALARPLLFPEDDAIIAIATDSALDPAPSLPVLDLNDVPAIADFVRRYAGSRGR